MSRALRGVLNLKNLLAGAALFFIIVCAIMVAALVADQPQSKPDLNVRVVDFEPKEYVRLLEPTNITVTFSRDLMPNDSLNILTADVPLEIKPPISGLARWVDNNKLVFYPDSAFRPSTEYEVKIKSDRGYLSGNRINDIRIFKFHSPAFTVVRVRTELIDVPEPAFQKRVLMHIGFNYPVRPDELQKHMSSTLRGRHGEIPFEVKDTAPSAELTVASAAFRPQDISGDFQFVITKGLNCIGGTIPLAGDYRQKYSVPKAEPLVVSRVYPEGAGQNARIEIELSQSVALIEMKEYINITPSIDFIVNQYYNRIELLGNFQPKETYTVNIKKGLHALNGEELESDFSTIVQIGDLPPSLKFVDEGQYISKGGRKLLAIETVNVDEITIEIEQIFVNNIVYYLTDYWRGYYGRDIGRVGRSIFFKDFRLASTLNLPLTSTIDIGQIVGDTLQGIYVVSVRQKDRRWNSNERRIMISDLGIMARMSDNYLMVWVNSLSGTGPVGKADVTLLSRNNQVLVEGKTDSRGIAILENIADRLKDFVPYVITVSKDRDLSYLQFNDCLIYTADADVGGRSYLSRGYEAFIYSDRGVYRPGETLHLVSVVRGVNGSVAPEFPYIIAAKDPEGRDFEEYKLTTKDQGISSIDIDMPGFAKTGSYSFLAKIGDDVSGQYSIQVEEFMPDRIKATLSTDKDTYTAGDVVQISVNGTFLFGPPCAGNTVNGHLTIESDYFSPRAWKDYLFSDPEIEFTPIQVDLPTDKLDDKGSHAYGYEISQNLRPPSSLKMLVSATVLEEGGRAVSAYKGVTVNPYPVCLGIKESIEGYAKAGQTITFSTIAVDGRAALAPVDSVWVKFYRVIYQNIVKKDRNGVYRYVSESKDQIIDSSSVSITDGPATVAFTPEDYGAYKARVTSKRTAHTAAVTFYVAGWGYSPWSMANPDKIDLQFDRKLYKAGDRARLLVKAPFEGKLLLTIEKDKVLDIETYDLDSNTAEIELPVKKEYSPNIYVTGTLVKSTTSLERFSPARAFGIVPLTVENASMKVGLEIRAPDVMKPRQKLDIDIRSNLKTGTKITVAAVDVGILQLTDFKTPDPFQFFFGKKRPALKPYDIYSLIFPDIKEAESKLTPAGSAAYEAGRKRHLNPITVTRVKPVALWSGIVATDTGGVAHISFNVPQFNGKLAIMAVAFNGDRCGSAVDEVTVRDKIVIQESLPRFIAPGDKISTPVVIFNNTGKADSFSVSMKITGPASLYSPDIARLFVPDNAKSVAMFSYKAENRPGKVAFEISATDGVEQSIETVELASRPGQPLLTLHGSGSVKAGSPAHVTMPGNWLEGTAQCELRLSSLPAVRLTNSIQFLLVYPYGCIEQTTSRLFPLLYFNDLARFAQPGIFGTRGQDYFIGEGILKISGMQLPSGAFMYWSGDNTANPWASIYASHFLVEARKAGYHVSNNVYDKALDNLQKMARDETLGENRVVLRIYAAYVLAKAGQLDRSVINSLKMLNVEVIPLYSKFQLAAAIAMTDGVNDALWLIPVEIHPLRFEPETGGYFDSDIRANAILLDVLSEIAPDNPSIPELVKDVSDKLYIGGWYSTQSTAWALMAIGKYLKTQETPDYTGAIVVNGRKYKQFSAEDLRISDIALGDQDIEISINGRGTCYYYWQASGVSADKSVKEFDSRLQVRREYLDSDGNPLDTRTVKLGDQVVAKITAEALDKNLENVVISDMLPACLEIENSRLQPTGRLSWLPQSSYYARYMDVRDDRMLLFSDLRLRERFVFYYSLRVVSIGDFNIPPTAAECMYDPTISSAASSGHMTVRESE